MRTKLVHANYEFESEGKSDIQPSDTGRRNLINSILSDALSVVDSTLSKRHPHTLDESGDEFTKQTELNKAIIEQTLNETLATELGRYLSKYREVLSTDISVEELDRNETDEDLDCPGSGLMRVKVLFSMRNGRRRSGSPSYERCRSQIVSFCETPELCENVARAEDGATRSGRSSEVPNSDSDDMELETRVIKEV